VPIRRKRILEKGGEILTSPAEKETRRERVQKRGNLAEKRKKSGAEGFHLKWGGEGDRKKASRPGLKERKGEITEKKFSHPPKTAGKEILTGEKEEIKWGGEKGILS